MREAPPDKTRPSQLANAEVQAVQLHSMHTSFILDCPVALIGPYTKSA